MMHFLIRRRNDAFTYRTEKLCVFLFDGEIMYFIIGRRNYAFSQKKRLSLLMTMQKSIFQNIEKCGSYEQKPLTNPIFSIFAFFEGFLAFSIFCETDFLPSSSKTLPNQDLIWEWKSLWILVLHGLLHLFFTPHCCQFFFQQRHSLIYVDCRVR